MIEKVGGCGSMVVAIRSRSMGSDVEIRRTLYRTMAWMASLSQAAQLLKGSLPSSNQSQVKLVSVS
jgi:hypothetical protein